MLITPNRLLTRKRASGGGFDYIEDQTQTISPSKLNDPDDFGDPALGGSFEIGSVTLSPTMVVSSGSFESPIFSTGAVSVSPSKIPASSSFGSPTVDVETTTEYTLFDVTPSPSTQVGDSAVWLGVPFRISQAGLITAVRFFKPSGATSSHVGRIYHHNSASMVGSGTSSGESASGWQRIELSSPVSLTVGDTYYAFVRFTDGNYHYTANYFGESWAGYGVGYLDVGPLTLLSSGRYDYGTNPAIPPANALTNYWVDVVFTLS